VGLIFQRALFGTGTLVVKDNSAVAEAYDLFSREEVKLNLSVAKQKKFYVK
jgi:hypothetical protein